MTPRDSSHRSDAATRETASTDALGRYLEGLVEVESPSPDTGATRACAEAVAGLSRDLLDSRPEYLVLDGRTHLRWRFGGQSRVMMLGHFDTVWPLGTLDHFPYVVEGGRATGPGVFDMKAGIVQLLLTLRALEDLSGVTVLLTSDEEIGASTSRGLIEEEARRNMAVLVFEPSFNGALKIARKGAASYHLQVRGRSAHAGLDPHSGVNAALDLAHQIVRIGELSDSSKETTVTPTLMTGGHSRNTVPSAASVYVDVRAASAAEQERVDRTLRALSPVVQGSQIEVDRLSWCPPMPAESSSALFEMARGIAEDLDLELEGAHVGGASDGNLTAAVGTPTLDGLGAVGGNAHAAGEFVLLDEIPVRTRLCAALTSALLTAR